jgi:ABC-type sugar transport system permease subunit
MGMKGKTLSATRNRWGVIFILPALVFFAVFGFFPFLYTFGVSLCKYDLISLKFVGMDNYLSLLEDDQFLNSLKITLYYVAGVTIPIWFLALGLALLLNTRIKFMGFYRTAYFIPVVMSLVGVSVIWTQLVHPYGLINQAIQWFTGHSLAVDWTADESLALPGLILVNLWKMIGYYGVLYLAGLQGIPPEYHEAACIDGASGWKRFRHITWPLLIPTTVFIMIISIINAFSAFVTIFMMTGGGPAEATRVLALFIYQNAFQYSKMGTAASVSFYAFLIILILTFIQLRLSRSSEKIY